MFKPANLPTLFLVSLLLFAGAGLAWAGDKPAYRDVYLTEGRVCKRCTWQWVSKQQVALTNRKGEQAIVEAREIIGVDKHPLMRKMLLKSLHGVGLPGKVIVPFAFEDGQDFVCKYCD